MTQAGKIRVRTYSAGSGYCFLVSIPGADRTRHAIMGFGNALGAGGSNALLHSIAQDIGEQTRGHLDVIVVPNEQTDNLVGLYRRRGAFRRMQVDNVWMGMPSHPEYYDEHPGASVHRRMKRLADGYGRTLEGQRSLAPSFRALLRNNVGNARSLDYVRNELGSTTWYLARGANMQGTGLGGVRVKVLAPEDDVGTYYAERPKQLASRVRALSSAQDPGARDPWSFPHVERAAKKIPVNLTESEWRRLLEEVGHGGVDAVRSLHGVHGDTSLVLSLEVRSKVLLFAGNAGARSWELMARKGLLGPVDFLGAGPWADLDGTPGKHLHAVLPHRRKRAVAVVSTSDKTRLAALKRRSSVRRVDDNAGEPWFDVHI